MGITGHYSDEQCGNYFTDFYEIRKQVDSVKKINDNNILPALSYRDFLKNSKAIPILEKYLPEIKTNYLGPDADIESLLEEIYNIHYTMPKKGTTLKATLTTCDYIPRNLGIIKNNDWEIIEKDFQTIELLYDKKLKNFNLLLKK